jgi:hypothetical protein
MINVGLDRRRSRRRALEVTGICFKTFGVIPMLDRLIAEEWHHQSSLENTPMLRTLIMGSVAPAGRP